MVIIILLYKGIHRAFFFNNECRGFEKLNFICTGHSLNHIKNFSVLKIYSLSTYILENLQIWKKKLSLRKLCRRNAKKTLFCVLRRDEMTPGNLVCFYYYYYYYKSVPIPKHICELGTSSGRERRALEAKCCCCDEKGLAGSRRRCQIPLNTVRFAYKYTSGYYVMHVITCAVW